jgi:general secretion pathway protein F
MNEITIDDFLALNGELAALEAAGSPIARALVPPGANVAAAMEKLNTSVARRVSRGESLAEAIEENEAVPSSIYRSLVSAGIRSGDLQLGLRSASQLAMAADDSFAGRRASLLYPLLVCCFALAGVTVFLAYPAPQFDVMLRDAETFSRGDAHPAIARGTPIAYATAATAATAIVVILVVIQTGRRRTTLRGDAPANGLLSSGDAVSWQRWATFARNAAALAGANVPLDESLQLAAGADDDENQAPAPAIAASNPSRQAIGPVEQERAAFPPFLRWALFDSEPAVSRPAALNMVAEAYAIAADRRHRQAQLTTPLVACVLVGGSVTLLYGLALFLPTTRLLERLAYDFVR